MNINPNLNNNFFTKSNVAIVLIITIVKNFNLQKNKNLSLVAPLNLISKLTLLINLFAGQFANKTLHLTRKQLKEFIINHHKYIFENRHVLLFTLAGFKIYGFKRQYMWFISRILIRAFFITFKRLTRIYNRFIKNWLNILFSKSDFFTWLKYFLKNFFYSLIVHEEIQHPRWIKQAPRSEEEPTVKIVINNPIERANSDIDSMKKFDIERARAKIDAALKFRRGSSPTIKIPDPIVRSEDKIIITGGPESIVISEDKVIVTGTTPIVRPEDTITTIVEPDGTIVRSDGITITEEDYIRPDSK